MNRLRFKYTTILIVLSLLLSAGLQAIWLRQLFTAQQNQLKDEIERFVSNTVQSRWYWSVTTFEKPANIRRIRQLFLSPQWAQLRQAFDNMERLGLTSKMRIESVTDSTSVSMYFSIKNAPAKSKPLPPYTSDTGLSDAQLRATDSLSLILLQKDIAKGLRQMGITSPIYHNIHTYNMGRVFDSDLPKGLMPAYKSKAYTYGFQNHCRYQLCLPTINNLVWYRMRYYAASSLLMLVLTCTAFYFILRSLRNVRLYADARTDFVRNMTHELKTPIATVSVALESIKKYNLAAEPETLQNYIDISRQELHRLNLMVEKALNLGTGADDALPFKPQLYDVQSGLQQVVTSMQLQLSGKDAEIELLPSDEPCFILGDPVHLTNVFYNLLENAIKYTGTGLRMEISCVCDADKVTINFKDNGPGIDKIYHKAIFDKFFRVPAEGDTHDIKGSGLGLYYVKQMVEKHGGSITVKSEPGSGTCFTITLTTAS